MIAAETGRGMAATRETGVEWQIGMQMRNVPREIAGARNQGEIAAGAKIGGMVIAAEIGRWLEATSETGVKCKNGMQLPISIVLKNWKIL